LRNACADQRTDQSARRSTCARACKCRSDWTSNHEINSGKKQRRSNCGDGRENGADRSTNGASDSQTVSSVRACLQSKLFGSSGVGHEHANIVAAVTALQKRIDGRLGGYFALKKGCY